MRASQRQRVDHEMQYIVPRRETRLSRLAVSVVLVYIACSELKMPINISPADAWLLLTVLMVGFSRPSGRSVAQLFHTGYLALVLLATLGMLIAAPAAESVVDGLKFVAQIALIFWLLVPIVAMGVAEMRSPLRLFEFWGWVALALVGTGALLQFGMRIDWIIYNSGNDRFLCRINLDLLMVSSLCFSVAALLTTGSNRLRRLIMAFASVIAVAVLAASRTGFVIVGAVVGLAAVRSMSSLRRVWVGVVMVSGALVLLSSDFIQRSLDIRVVEARQLYWDDTRIGLMVKAVREVVADPNVILFGVGWGSSGSDVGTTHTVVHNVLLQVLTETGVPAGLVLWVLLAMPFVWIFRARRADQTERLFAFFLYVAQFTQWMFHPISTERHIWLTFAVLVGMGYRLRLQHNRASKRQGSPSATLGRSRDGRLTPRYA